MEDGQLLLKISSIGDKQVGKSCLIKRYCEGRFVNKYITTIGVDYGVKKMNIQQKKCSINFFDLSGDDDYKDIRNEFFKDSQGILMVFDLNNEQSFNNLQKWENTMSQNKLNFQDSIIFVVGNKSDQQQVVQDNQVQQYCKKKGYQFFKTSALNGDNVNQVFESLFQKIVTKILEEQRVQQK
ncbi:P-loop containing nucleoside triphosphate hydrolase [Pseudocohnilembus persalinus]|uniref:p-loop containing nucleoside triphosphate hydrolase n=1 Tax=Pseudocohnilembus persalinus TaxID=266149 RepID=A0A0V0R871_PSEPJ|nr:P-loop containing nucleoside triphosphate hydrolase [Pseudocohnilembus persalinus]|eukprot:KRX10695.1 P-loop containing nucleoside triphosphate hydrolase [Pseudocohnilembus persalinus]